MPTYILKLEDRHFLYSTVMDAPVSEPMALEEFKVYYMKQATAEAEQRLQELLGRVEAKGTSSYSHESAEATLQINHVGPDSCCATIGVLRNWVLNHHTRWSTP